jgi:hypothetical protein
MSCKVSLTPLYTRGTLYDDLYVTRSSDDQIKTLRSRKADKEGHCAGALTNALFRITFVVRFGPRGEAQSLSVSKRFEDVFIPAVSRAFVDLLLQPIEGTPRCRS